MSQIFSRAPSHCAVMWRFLAELAALALNKFHTREFSYGEWARRQKQYKVHQEEAKMLSPHTHSCDCLMIYLKGQFLMKCIFFPLLFRNWSSVFIICTQTRDSLNRTVRKSPQRLKHLVPLQSVLKKKSQHLREVLSIITLRSVAFMT